MRSLYNLLTVLWIRLDLLKERKRCISGDGDRVHVNNGTMHCVGWVGGEKCVGVDQIALTISLIAHLVSLA